MHQHEIQVSADVGHHRHAGRGHPGEEAEHHRQHQEIGEGAAGVEQQQRRTQQRATPGASRGWYRPGATKAHAWYSSHGIASISATKNASFIGAKNGAGDLDRDQLAALRQLVEQRLREPGVQPVGERQQAGQHQQQADHPAQQARTQLQQVRDQRAFGVVAGVSLATGRPGPGLARPGPAQGRLGLDAWAQELRSAVCARALDRRWRNRAPGFPPRACASRPACRLRAQLVAGQLAFELGLHRIPLRARAAHPQAGEARGLRQALGAEHDQRHHGDDQQFAEADVEHRVGRVARLAGDVVAVASRFRRRRAVRRRLVATGGSRLSSSPRMPFLKPLTASPRSLPPDAGAWCRTPAARSPAR